MQQKQAVKKTLTQAEGQRKLLRQDQLATWKNQKPADLPGRGLDQLKNLEMNLSNLWSCLQAEQYVPSP